MSTEPTKQPLIRSAPGRWLYVIPALLLAGAGWTLAAQRASSSIGPLTADEAAGLEPATDQSDPRRFRVIRDGVIEDTATGIRRRVTGGSGPDIPERFAEGSGDGSGANDNLADDRRDGVGPRPERVLYSSIGLDAGVLPIGLDRSSALAVPRRADITGWWSGGSVPGEDGPTVIVGHYDSKVAAGVFEQLPSAKVGQSIIVVQSDGSKYLYRVTEVEKLKKSVFPTAKVYAPTSSSTLRLITCGGAFDRSTGHYVDNLIVYADVVPLTPGRGLMLGYVAPEYFPVVETTLVASETTVASSTTIAASTTVAVSTSSTSSTTSPTPTNTAVVRGSPSSTAAVSTPVPTTADSPPSSAPESSIQTTTPVTSTSVPGPLGSAPTAATNAVEAPSAPVSERV